MQQNFLSVDTDKRRPTLARHVSRCEQSHRKHSHQSVLIVNLDILVFVGQNLFGWLITPIYYWCDLSAEKLAMWTAAETATQSLRQKLCLYICACELLLHCRCVLNWFGDWSNGALYQVGKEFTNKIDLEKTNVFISQLFDIFPVSSCMSMT